MTTPVESLLSREAHERVMATLAEYIPDPKTRYGVTVAALVTAANIITAAQTAREDTHK